MKSVPFTAGILFLLILLNGVSGYSQTYGTEVERSAGEQTLLVVGSALASIVYTPVKAAYALGGSVFGGMVYIMSAGQSGTAATLTIDRATRGDWFITPEHLTGERPIEFIANTSGLPDRNIPHRQFKPAKPEIQKKK